MNEVLQAIYEGFVDQLKNNDFAKYSLIGLVGALLISKIAKWWVNFKRKV